MILPPNVIPVYARKQQIRLRPFQRIVIGDAVECDLSEGLEFVKYVPDPDHQSSLDYLRGV